MRMNIGDVVVIGWWRWRRAKLGGLENDRIRRFSAEPKIAMSNLRQIVVMMRRLAAAARVAVRRRLAAERDCFLLNLSEALRASTIERVPHLREQQLVHLGPATQQLLDRLVGEAAHTTDVRRRNWRLIIADVLMLKTFAHPSRLFVVAADILAHLMSLVFIVGRVGRIVERKWHVVKFAYGREEQLVNGIIKAMSGLLEGRSGRERGARRRQRRDGGERHTRRHAALSARQL